MRKIQLKIKLDKIIILPYLLMLFLVVGCGKGGAGGGGESNFGGNGMGNSPSSGNNPAFSGSVTLAWDEPATNADGSPLTDLKGYKVYYGDHASNPAQPRNYRMVADIGNNTSAVIENLTPGPWCFAVTALDYSGNESAYSDEVCTTINVTSPTPPA